MDKKVTEVVEAFAQPIVEELNLELVDVEYVKEGQDWFLRVFIDSEKGVDIEECGAVSERLSEALDKEGPNSSSLLFGCIISWSGTPIKEKDFQQAVGKQVAIKTYEPIDGEKMFEGKLLSYDGTTITLLLTIKTRKKEIQISMDKVANARLAVTF